jgi:hypothetical protein
MQRTMRMAPRQTKQVNKKGNKHSTTVSFRVEPARITMKERIEAHCERHPNDLVAQRARDGPAGDEQ